MQTLLTIILLLVVTSSFGQNKNFHGITSSTSDTIFWYKHQSQKIKKLSLASLDTSTDKEHCRVWTNKQVIDVWESQSGTITGILTTWVDEYVQYDETPTNRTFTMVNLLNTDTAKLIRQLIFSSDILNLPSDDSIKGWKQGFDGITYIIESSTKNYYTFKTYWTPKAQDSLQEAVQVQTFIDNLLSLVNAQATWKSFAKTIPYECFINGGPSVVCKVLTKKERKKYVKERKKYCQQSIAKSGTDK